MILRFFWKSLIESLIFVEKFSEYIELIVEIINGYFVYIWNEEVFKLIGLIEISLVKYLFVLGMLLIEVKIMFFYGILVL